MDFPKQKDLRKGFKCNRLIEGYLRKLLEGWRSEVGKESKKINMT